MFLCLIFLHPFSRLLHEKFLVGKLGAGNWKLIIKTPSKWNIFFQPLTCQFNYSPGRRKESRVYQRANFD